jgi:hypothetical protein
MPKLTYAQTAGKESANDYDPRSKLQRYVCPLDISTDVLDMPTLDIPKQIWV